MRYVERPPHSLLASHLECLWLLADEGHAPALEPSRVFPDGCIELIVHAGTPFQWRAPDGALHRQPEAFVVGQLSRPLWLLPEPGFASVAARFRPGGAAAYFGVPLAELADRVVPLAELWGAAAARELAGALQSVAGDAARLDALERSLLARDAARRAVPAGTRAALARLLESRGRVRVEAIARDAGWSGRQLERRFAHDVGCSPRQLARTVRFQRLLATLPRDTGGDWAGLAWDCGFADQAHLIREFRRFTGATPTRLNDQALALARQFVSPERLRAYFATR